jgi:IBR domain, a half RING-finger domain
MPWHSGQTCDEYEVERKERVAQEVASMQILDETTKICPNTKCGLHVVKISDCDHMTCKSLNLLQILLLIFQGHKCKFEFCWICLAPYRQIRQRGNSFHAAGCKYYSSNLPNAPTNIGIAIEAPFNHAYPAPPQPTVNTSTAATLNVAHDFGVLPAIEAHLNATFEVHPPPPPANPISTTTAPKFPTTGP